jgi:hypothetical protein
MEAGQHAFLPHYELLTPLPLASWVNRDCSVMRLSVSLLGCPDLVWRLSTEPRGGDPGASSRPSNRAISSSSLYGLGEGEGDGEAAGDAVGEGDGEAVGDAVGVPVVVGPVPSTGVVVVAVLSGRCSGGSS